MRDFEMDDAVIKEMAEELAAKNYGKGECMEKKLCIEGTTFYTAIYRERGLDDCPDLELAGITDHSSDREISAAVAFAAYEHFLGDLDWAWEHFGGRTDICDLEGCKAFIKAHANEEPSA